jgi:DNA-binding PucR family transcriptional regulator
LRIGAILRAPQRVHRYADVAVLDLVGVGSAAAEEFVRRVPGSLSSTRGGETDLETLRQLSASGYRIEPAAAALSVHPHTLTYRVKQIRHRFGLDLDDPEVRLRVQLALLIIDA